MDCSAGFCKIESLSCDVYCIVYFKNKGTRLLHKSAFGTTRMYSCILYTSRCMYNCIYYIVLLINIT